MSSGAAQSPDLTYGEEPKVSDPRLKELMLYVCDKCIDDQYFGATKLNKILYVSDLLAFRHLGKSITGSRYTRRDRGPVPHRLPALREEMLGTDLVVKQVESGQYIRHKYIALRPAEIDSHFTPREISLVDDIIDVMAGMNATEVSDMTHGSVWKDTMNGDPITYESVYISDQNLDETDV